MSTFLTEKRVLITFFSIMVIIFWFNPAQATTYLYFDAENGVDGAYLPNPPFCQTECSGIGEKGTYQSVGGAPQGSKYFQWRTVNNQNSAYNNVSMRPPFPISCSLGRTYYIAYFFNFTKIDGREIWHRTGDSADKGVEIVGNGIRWIISRGHWDNLAPNQANKYTIWGGNPSYHINRSLENHDIYLPNQSGFSANNPIQLEYDKWHSAVMAVKLATDSTGSFTVYINGIRVLEYTNIITSASSSPSIECLTMGGTIAQPAYDAPAHLRKFDALLLTDNWQDILNGGYMSANPSPSPPTGLRIVN